uniref:Peptidoglycan D,D-transpeptidase MrdA n=1 Tax=Candidatus Kentrum sp. UNK TaxID=2126344 RepID=A0A451AFT9_9GAMM|nr:MAG: penicillin-binding protein 2 [Candidatus Kentron sp. UNK]VFK71249.1 MAG: penicillin-binding protein 2 [Candidatus Kentron sp. UNK]
MRIPRHIESPGLTIKNSAGESSLFRARLILAHGVIILLSLVLIAQLTKLQVFKHEHFQTLSHENSVKIVPLSPSRGLIFDRNGVVLARNIPSYSLEVVPEAVPNMEAMLREIADIITLDKEDYKRFRRSLNRTRRFQSIPLKHRLSEVEVARFAVNRYRFPGVDIQARLMRDYPRGAMGVHVIGYVSRINEQELAKSDPINYRGTDHIGKTGVEHAYEELLHGRVGYQHVEVNAQGRTIRVLSHTPPVPGADLYLTIDATLQAVAEAALKEEKGAVVAMEPSSGAILALASMPGFDPNLFVRGIKEDVYNALQTSQRQPLFNRALSGQYPPGSVVKPFIGLAGLEYEPDHVNRGMWCPGWYRLKGLKHVYRDWKKNGHGQVNLHRAIVESCDVYFYDLARRLSIENIHDYLTNFGFGRKTGIDLPGEMPGLIPSNAWKRANRNEIWFPGETLITGIGQGFTLATPLQLAVVTATLSMRGLRLEPGIVHRTITSMSEEDIVNPTHVGAVSTRDPANWDKIIDAMIDVVHGAMGTARDMCPDCAYQIAGKTGTAQVFSLSPDEKYNGEELDKRLHDHGLFIGFAPVDDPRIAISVIVENGGNGSQSAAPIARAVLDQYLNER